jgi:alkaline phosphatase D
VSIGGDWQKRRVGNLEGLGGIDRRTFVKLSGMSAAALIFGLGPFTEEAVARTRFSDYPFSLGVASGDPLPSGVVLWTRLATDPLAEDGNGGMPPLKVPVYWEVAEDERFRKVVRRGKGFARPELAHSLHVEVGGLKPAREYFYRFRAGFELSATGRTKTAPVPGASVDALGFAFASCQMYEHGYYTAYRRMSEEDLDLVVHLGDYIYEYGPNQYVAQSGNVRTHNSPEIFTLPEYRSRYALYKTDEDLQAAHAAFPWIVTWDDHEVENNYADEVSEIDSEPDQDPEVFLMRRAAAYQAYYEHMPLRRTSVPQGPDMRLYRRISYGNLAEFNVLDTRQYRDDQAAADPERQDPSRTITGEQQEQWLLDGLATSGAIWKVLAQQVFFAKRDGDPGEGERYNMDPWDGYLGSRNRVLEFIQQLRIENPIVLTGDAHNNWAAELKANFEDPNSETLGVEFIGTSITSGGDGADTPGPNQQAVLEENPHIKFFNGQRGYVLCRLTPELWHADYPVLPYVKEPGAPIYTRASFAVEAGKPGLQQVGETAVPTRASSLIESDSERIRAQKRADGRQLGGRRR